MPCYEAPPEYEGDARRSAEKAVQFMCADIRASLSAGNVPQKDRLRWYVEHRRIDLRIASDRRGSGYADDPDIIREIGLLEMLIQSGEQP